MISPGRRRLQFPALLFVLSLALPSVVFAQENPLPDPIRVVISVLGLNEQQAQGFVGIVQAREQAIRPLAEEAQARHQSLEKTMQSTNPDVALVGTAVIEISQIEKRVGQISADAAAQFDQLLTPEQRQQLQRIREAASVCPAVPAFHAAGLL